MGKKNKSLHLRMLVRALVDIGSEVLRRKMKLFKVHRQTDGQTDGQTARQMTDKQMIRTFI